MNKIPLPIGLWQRYGALIAVIFLLVSPSNGRAEEPSVKIPQFINPNVIITSGSTPTIRTIRFLTTDDFPPFNFIDQEGRLEGFNVSLARALCFEIKARCTMQAVPWGELNEALSAGQGDAIIAGLALSKTTIKSYAFSKPYLRLPARFMYNKKSELDEKAFKGPGTLTVGVEAGTAHEAFLKEQFPQTPIKQYGSQEDLRRAIREGEVSLGFANGVDMSFWFQSSTSEECCGFIGGPYLSSEYFGEGLSIAVPADRIDLKQVLDNGLGRLMREGKYAEIYLQFFPVSFF